MQAVPRCGGSAKTFNAVNPAGSAVVLHTGRAADFFLVQILSHALGATAWALSIAGRWPLLGVIVGVVLGRRAAWRRDPAL